MKIDYIIVGCGLAGLAFCERLRKNNKSFIVFDDASQKSSLVAAGMYNPVILKRFTEVWMAKEQLDLAKPFYKELESLLGVTLDYEIQLFRLFASIEEQNGWFHAMDNPNLEPFLSETIIQNQHIGIDAEFGFGEVLQAGRIDTKSMLASYHGYLGSKNLLLREKLSFDKLQFDDGIIKYEHIQANKIVFCEGFGLKNNPFFNNLPLSGTKGEVITIKAPDLNLDFAIKSSVFLIPEPNNLYKVGATYNRKDKTQDTTVEAKNELVDKLNRFLKCDYEVVNQAAGIRPTVKDRRPLVGSHNKYKNVYVLNGLGTRGVMIAPYAADQLYNYIENTTELNSEININRFVS